MVSAYLWGMVIMPEDYWTERSSWIVCRELQRSVYIIQGMQDWNVDPHMAVPTHQIVRRCRN